MVEQGCCETVAADPFEHPDLRAADEEAFAGLERTTHRWSVSDVDAANGGHEAGAVAEMEQGFEPIEPVQEFDRVAALRQNHEERMRAASAEAVASLQRCLGSAAFE